MLGQRGFALTRNTRRRPCITAIHNALTKLVQTLNGFAKTSRYEVTYARSRVHYGQDDQGCRYSLVLVPSNLPDNLSRLLRNAQNESYEGTFQSNLELMIECRESVATHQVIHPTVIMTTFSKKKSVFLCVPSL